MIEGVHVYKSNKEFAMKVLAKYMKVQDREILEENFREYDFPLKPYPSKEYFELPIQEVGKKDPKVLERKPGALCRHVAGQRTRQQRLYRQTDAGIPSKVTEPLSVEQEVHVILNEVKDLSDHH